MDDIIHVFGWGVMGGGVKVGSKWGREKDGVGRGSVKQANADRFRDQPRPAACAGARRRPQEAAGMRHEFGG